MVNELSVQSRLRPLKAPQKKTSDPVTFTNSNAKMQYNQGAVEKKKIVTTFATGHTVIKIKARPPAREGGSAHEVEELAKLQMVTIHGPLQNTVYMCIKKNVADQI